MNKPKTKRIMLYFKPLFIFLLSFLALATFGQGQKYVFLEGLGAGVYASVNFDMRFKKERNDGFGFRAGIGNSVVLDENITTIPFGVNYVFGKNKHGLLLGANGTVGIFEKNREDAASDRAGGFVPSLELGYRYRPRTKGFAFQTTFNPLFNTVDGAMPLFFGVGLGYAWK